MVEGYEGPLKVDGYYSLRTDGQLLYTAAVESMGPTEFLGDDGVQAFWPFDASDRESAWTIVVEARASGAAHDRVDQLAGHWQLLDADGRVYAERVGAKVEPEGREWRATKADGTGPAGYGRSVLEALSELAVRLGYRAEKVGGPSFSALVKRD